jgi:hypothetical protein
MTTLTFTNSIQRLEQKIKEQEAKILSTKDPNLLAHPSTTVERTSEGVTYRLTHAGKQLLIDQINESLNIHRPLFKELLEMRQKLDKMKKSRQINQSEVFA